MSNFELLKFSNDQALAEAVANEWLDEASSLGSLALSGGRIARRLFVAAAKSVGAAEKLKAIDFFWADERCVPPADPESNFGIAQELLFSPLRIPKEKIHRIKGETQPEQAAREAEAELKRTVMRTRKDQPILDLVLLGMGEDGHVASLFPGEPREMVNDPALYRAVIASKPPPNRVTLGYQAIFVAERVWVVASGAGKEQALRDSIAQNGDTPLARVLQNRKGTRIFTDISV